MRRKPTRTDLLRVIGKLQDLIGGAHGRNHDRNPNRVAEVTAHLQEAHKLCIEALGFEQPPVRISRNGWGDYSDYDERIRQSSI